VDVRPTEGLASGVSSREVMVTTGREGRPTFAEEWLVAVLDSLDEAVDALDADGRIVAANPSAERLLDFIVGEWRDRSFAELRWGLHAVVGAAHAPVSADRDTVAATMSEHRARHRQVLAVEHSDHRRWLSVNTRYLPASVEDGRGVVVTITDVTDRVAAEEALREQLDVLERMNEDLRRANTVKDAFLAMASDELRNPIASLLGFAEMLDEDWDGVTDEERRTYVATIHTQARRLAGLIGDLLLATHLQSGTTILREPQEVRLEPIVTRAVAELGEPTPDRIEVSADLVAQVDPAHLVRIVASLVDNAVKHGERPIVVSAQQVGEDAEIRVCDAGPGVPPHFVPLMFDVFSQASTGTARLASGAGLGLMIAQGLARLNGGDLRYEKGDPAGASLIVRLPGAGRAEDGSEQTDPIASSRVSER
jgi:PAS domain S-box-containing protein